MADLRETLSAGYDKLAESAPPAKAESVDTPAAKADKGETKSEPVAGGDKSTPAKVPEKAAKGEVKSTPAAAATPQERAKAPSSWAAEYHDHFGKLDPRLQEYILQREKQASDGLSQYGDKLKKLEPLGALEPMLAPWRQKWSQYGLNDAQGLGRMFETYSEYLNNPKSFIEKQARALGLQFQQQEQAEQYQSQEQPQPQQIEQLVGGYIQQAVEPLKRQLQEQRNREFLAQINSFASAKDEGGNVMRPYFEDVRGDIMGWFQSIMQSEPQLSFTEALSKAYDKATWGNEGVRAKILEAERTKAEEARVKEERERDEHGRFVKAEEAKKSAVKSEPPESGESASGKRKKKDVRTRLSETYDRLAGDRASI